MEHIRFVGLDFRRTSASTADRVGGQVSAPKVIVSNHESGWNPTLGAHAKLKAHLRASANIPLWKAVGGVCNFLSPRNAETTSDRRTWTKNEGFALY